MPTLDDAADAWARSFDADVAAWLMRPGGDLVVPGPPRWSSRAACRYEDPSLFFAEGRGSGAAGYRAAKAVCGDCPVRGECLEFAMAAEDGEPKHRYGVWGGLTARERIALARQRAEEAAAVERARERLRGLVPA